jgi:hypothetical protein
MTDVKIDTIKLNDPSTREAFGTVRKSLALYGVICALVLGTVAVVSFTGHSVSAFMWIRGVILLAVAPLLYRMAGQAARGGRRSFKRLETVTAILPIAIIVVDLIPGVCPAWYAAMQAIAALPLIAVAVMTRRQLRSVFPR